LLRLLLAAVLALGSLFAAAPAWAEEAKGQASAGEEVSVDDSLSTEGGQQEGQAPVTGSDAAPTGPSEGLTTPPPPDDFTTPPPLEDAAPAETGPEGIKPLSSGLEPLAATGGPGWIKAYGGASHDFFETVIQTSDGGFVAVGGSTSADSDFSSEASSYQGVIARFDSNGNRIWFRLYGAEEPHDENDHYTIFYSVVATPDGGFVAAGTSKVLIDGFTGSYGRQEQNFILVKFDANGNRIWAKIHGGSSVDEFHSLIQTSDGSLIAAGLSESWDGDLSGAFINDSPVIAKFNANGEKIWIKYCDVGQRDAYFDSIVQAPNGDFVAVGTLRDYYFSEDFLIARLDANGEKIWSKTYGGDLWDYLYSVTPTSDGGFVAVGSAYSQNGDLVGTDKDDKNFVIVKFDANGYKVWLRTYGGRSYDELNSVVQTSDGSFVAVGISSSSDGDLPQSSNTYSYEFVIAKFAPNGNKVWIKTHGGNNMDDFYSVIQTPDGGFVAVGSSLSPDGKLPGNRGQGDFVIAKFDSEGGLNLPVKNGWMKYDGYWYYYKDNFAIWNWFRSGGYWYYFDSNTRHMLTGMHRIGNSTYLFAGGDSGRMLTGWQKHEGKWYYFQPSGAAKTGWMKSGGSWYYLNPATGQMLTGMHRIGNSTYLLAGGDSGRMLTGWQQHGSSWYYFQSSGAAKAGWMKSGLYWYYLDPATLQMATDWQSINNKGTASWYYFDGGSGRMTTGTAIIDGTAYTFAPSGALTSHQNPASLGG
jgi:glucan-binding YG repeat protein